MTSPTRKRGPEESEEGDSQSASKFLITDDKPIPATNNKDVYLCKACNREFKSYQALGGHMTKHRSSGKEEKVKSELSKEKTVLENITTSKSDSNSGEKSVGDKSGCNFSALVPRDFFPMEPLWVRAEPAEVVPVLERANSSLDLKLGF